MILGVICLYFAHGAWQRWLRRRRFRGAKRSEQKAAQLLERDGFKIISRQPTASSLTYIDGKPHTTTIRADFKAKKGWRTYVVEVKSGRTATRLNAKTRRQLLEYQLAFRVNSILLVDMNKKKWREISFRWPSGRTNMLSTAMAVIVAFILGGAVAYVLCKGMW